MGDKMIKIFRESSSENNKKDFILAKRIVEIILYLIASIQLFQEFSDSRYFDQFLIILTMTGMFVFICGALKKYSYTADNFEVEYHNGQKEMMDFHNNFIASMFIPMIFLFNTDNVIFTGTSLWDLNSMKLIILMIAFISVLYYRFLVFFSKRYSEKIKTDEEFEESNQGIRYYNHLLYLSGLGLLIDLALFLLNFYLVDSMEWKNVYFSNVTIVTYSLLFLCVFVLFFISDKKRIVLIITIAITLVSVLYSSYMQFSEVKPYDFGTTDYTNFYKFDDEDKTYVRVACRFETDESNKGVYKYYMALYEDDGDNLRFIEEAYAYGNYEAVEFKNSFFEWQDRASDIYYQKKNLEKGEKPVSFEIINEVVECKEESPLKEYIDSQKHTKLNFDDKETDSIIVGDDCITFRGNKLEKTDEIYSYIDKELDNIKM